MKRAATRSHGRCTVGNWPEYGRDLRQTEGLLRSLVTLLGFSVGVPDHATFYRRSPGLALATALAQAQASGPAHAMADATVRGCGTGVWNCLPRPPSGLLAPQNH